MNDEKALMLRGAIEHRATWFYLLLKEMKERSLNVEDIGRKAVYSCGCFHGGIKKENCEDVDDLRKFLEVFADETTRKVFEMEIKECTKDTLSIDFHYCPLVNAWKKLGVDDTEMPLLCDIAMEGDRGICDQFEGYDFQLGKVIAENNDICEIRIKKK